jgi:hypothetical protein
MIFSLGWFVRAVIALAAPLRRVMRGRAAGFAQAAGFEKQDKVPTKFLQRVNA